MIMTALFQTYFPTAKPPLLFSAPGRVNLIGEHTDYNNGFVLPMAIEFSTKLALSLRQDDLVRIYSMALDKYIEFHLTDSFDLSKRQWYYYVVGVLQLLKKRGHNFYGADITIDSNIPMGAGLSSSASLAMVAGFAFLSAHHLPINLIDLAKICQQAEHHYVGTQCGIMDQFICGLAQEHHALLIDCESLHYKPIPLNMGSVSWLICDTTVHHELASSAYNTRRQECEAGAKIMQLDSLRHVSLPTLKSYKSTLSSTVYQRCHHVITENERTLQATTAMQLQDWHALGALMVDSHRSLQHHYHVSCTELDFLVDSALTIPGVYGARMTGGGFGGCTVNLIKDAYINEFEQKITERYQTQFGYSPKIYRSKPQSGVKMLNATSVVLTKQTPTLELTS
ncbi:MAG: galactokinase [Gammaproteobacteria bacterium RIFCSPHIGHO2_12_FULL_42_13]|nr:MAG: galactokinase [Gammaproteobacteria bacterium RIFCSPHIGHO2_12_FULL_42_13]